MAFCVACPFVRGSSVALLAAAAAFHWLASLILFSSPMWLTGGRPTHALSTFSMQARCAKSALTTGAPEGTRGALHR